MCAQVAVAQPEQRFTRTVQKFQKKNSTGKRVAPTDASLTAQDTFGFGALESAVSDILRGKSLKAHDSRIRNDSRNYQSWLEAYTTFNAPESFEHLPYTRLVRRKGVRNLVINKIFVCNLEMGEQWGACEATRKRYETATKGSNDTRQKTSGHLRLVKDFPKAWSEDSMSRQEPVIGYENRRPPTVVQLLAEAYPESESRSAGKDEFILQREPSKPAEPVSVVAANDDHVDRAISSNYGSPANVDEDVQLRECASVIKRSNVRKGRPMFKTVQYAHFEGDKTCMGYRIEISGHLCSDDRYLQWLKNPDYLRELQYLAHDNYNIPTQGELYDFYWKTALSDESRLAMWLSDRDHLNPTRHPQGRVNLLFKYRLSDFRHKFNIGQMEERDFLKIEKGLLAAIVHSERSRARSPFAKQYNQALRGDGFVILDGGGGDYTCEEKIEMLVRENVIKVHGFLGPVSEVANESWPEGIRGIQIGLDSMPPLGDGYEPMNDMEYKNITRIKANDVDAHLWASKVVSFVGPMEHFVPEGDGRPRHSELQYQSARHYSDTQPARLPNSLILGDAFMDRTGAGILIPNQHSNDIIGVIKQVSRG